MVTEAKKEDIERCKKSFWALYAQGGNSVAKLIDSLAESMAYQYALNRTHNELIRDLVREDRREKQR